MQKRNPEASCCQPAEKKLNIEAGEYPSPPGVVSSGPPLICCQLCRGFGLARCGCIAWPSDEEIMTGKAPSVKSVMEHVIRRVQLLLRRHVNGLGTASNLQLVELEPLKISRDSTRAMKGFAESWNMANAANAMITTELYSAAGS